MSGGRDSAARAGAKIVLATVGSLGDLHPFIAIALALKQRGHRPVLAVPEDHLAKVSAAGLDGVTIMPRFEVVRERMGVPEHEAVQRIMADQAYMFDQALLPWLDTSTAAIDAAAHDADIVVASLFAFGAPIVAEKRDIPLVSVILQPMALLSAHEPPRLGSLWMMVRKPTTRLGLTWNRSLFALVRLALRRKYGRTIDSLRATHGLAPARVSPLDVSPAAALALCCYSPQFAPLPADAPAISQAVGFPQFDSASGAVEPPDAVLTAFLAAGTPPLVFTLGSFAVHAPGDFYAEAVATARALGRRAVLLTGPACSIASDDQILALDYAPHSALFDRALAIVHHGGIGTTGQALRSGKPQLVVPYMGDQPDNADRTECLGVGLRLSSRRFTAARAVTKIGALIDPANGYTARAARIGTIVAAEQGALNAAMAIEHTLRTR